MQRPSWNTLRQSWADLFFFEPLSEFLTRLHEDRGGEVVAVVMFSPEGGEIPPPAPPVHLLVLYQETVDFLKETQFLREHDPSGILNFFCYSLPDFQKMYKGSNPIAHQAVKTGLILFETDNRMEEFVS
ncbi:MAG TPA: hypothetical protein ENK09_03840 [Nitrospirae bacterium]|nr:hypothetical protein [Nitrospirota bacterium]